MISLLTLLGTNCPKLNRDDDKNQGWFRKLPAKLRK